MKKILHITNHIGVNAGGGIKSFLIDLLNYNSDKFENYLIFLGNQDDIDDLAISSFCKVFTINFDLTKRNNQLNIFQLLLLINSVDVVHQHSVWRFNSLLTIISSLFFKKKTIIQPHGALMQFAINQKSPYKKYLFYHLIEKYNLLLSYKIIVSSKEESLFFQPKKILYKKNELIPLGVKSNFVADKLKTKSSIFFKLCFISRIHPIKGIDNLIESVNMLEAAVKSKLRITIAGDGNESYLHHLKYKIQKFGLENIFTFIGFINEIEKKSLLDDSDFFILPSFSESFSISIVEALSRGVPVLTSSGTPWNDILVLEKCGLIFDPNPLSIHDVILESYHICNQKYSLFSSNAISLVKRDYIFEKNIDLINKLY